MDISLSGGLFIIHAAPEFEVGKKCKLTIYYAEKTVFLTIDGCVVHCHDDLIGIEFVTDSKLLEQSLQHLVDLNLGSSTLLKRDMPALLG